MNAKQYVCPSCKEEIKSDAIKCKHCHSQLAKPKPSHEGECPYCKEKIHPEAIKCKHCKSNLASNADTGCGCGTSQYNDMTALSNPTYRTYRDGFKVACIANCQSRFGGNMESIVWCIDTCDRNPFVFFNAPVNKSV